MNTYYLRKFRKKAKRRYTLHCSKYKHEYWYEVRVYGLFCEKHAKIADAADSIDALRRAFILELVASQRRKDVFSIRLTY